ncbi:tight adherence pilus pseudopilin TadF [Gilliamella sp. Pas-s25]|uniref:tight adherence pilus pseudopilin TadF n=1 Tax=Gilliamella sp. Pas-s25 TaxID=2687310 RepID=UPI00135D45F5|nr:tight adherence pilus pseudopilin TadF [Gilliamella sp. Pas-s25]MWP62647.1 hypothetical protein [Gilliamella sp. Pas-s25]
MKYSGNFFCNKDGVISIEFAACFCLFSALLFIIYDVYATIMLQNRLERTTYTVASVFRERSSLYPAKNAIIKNNKLELCNSSADCFKTYELFDDTQVEELRQLATKLLGGRDVSIQIEAFFMLQRPNDIYRTSDVIFSSKSCPSGVCNNKFNDFFNSLPLLFGRQGGPTAFAYFTRYAKRRVPEKYKNGYSYSISGRYVPFYRISMCIVNEESLYLKWINSSRDASDTLPNLCSDTVVLSRCNDVLDPDETSCPLYVLE